MTSCENQQQSSESNFQFQKWKQLLTNERTNERTHARTNERTNEWGFNLGFVRLVRPLAKTCYVLVYTCRSNGVFTWSSFQSLLAVIFRWSQLWVCFLFDGLLPCFSSFRRLAVSELLATENQDIQNNDDDCIDSPHAEIYIPSVYYLYLTFLVLFLVIYFFSNPA